ncbi:MAG: YoaK family protein [Eubacteriales bacterium]|nr:YoaK family protein [Eubacteriales bacterium]
MSEAFINTAFLALSGGLQDAYTYNVRDQVFSNAQTGNVVLMSQFLMSGQWGHILRYLFPLISFALGVWVTESIQGHFRDAKKMHWRQGILLAEIVILFIVGFIPGSLNMVATALVSFTCAMQVQAFRKVNGYAYASTMCIGNLRGGTAALSSFFRRHRKEDLKKAGYYFGVIFFFAVGAGLGGNLSLRYGYHVIWLSCALLFISFVLMYFERFRFHDHLL